MSMSKSDFEQKAKELLHRNSWKMLINGELRDAVSKKTLDAFSPATGEFLGRVPFAQVEDVEFTVQGAEKAFLKWKKTSIYERIELVRKLIDVLKAHKTELAILDSLDGGNPINACLTDVNVACAMMNYIAGAASEVKGEVISSTAKNWHFTRREPYGVVARITAFNHPLMFVAAKIAAPLVMGNTVIIKVPEQAPLSSLYFAELIKDIVPPGVVNILTGDGAVTGDAIVRHKKIKRIALIGSYETGRKILASAAEVGIKHVSLELGGKNPLIIYPDADVGKAAKSAFNGMNFCSAQGQSCGSTSRVFVHEAIHSDFLKALSQEVRNVKVGHPLDPQTEMGCLVSKQQFDKVRYYIEVGIQEGAILVEGGGKPEGITFENGYYIKPTIFDKVNYKMKIAQEEIFGPVLSVISWNDEEEMIEQVNSVSYGLTGGVWTNDINTAFRIIDELQSGYVWVNGSARHFLGVPFSGQKNSGLDSEEGIEELYSFTQNKSVNMMFE